MDQANLEWLTDAAPSPPVAASALLKQVGRLAPNKPLWYRPTSAETLHPKSRPALLVPHISSEAVIIDQSNVQRVVGVFGAVDTPYTVTPELLRGLNSHDLYVHCGSRRKVPAGAKVLALRDDAKGPEASSAKAAATGAKRGGGGVPSGKTASQTSLATLLRLDDEALDGDDTLSSSLSTPAPTPTEGGRTAPRVSLGILRPRPLSLPPSSSVREELRDATGTGGPPTRRTPRTEDPLSILSASTLASSESLATWGTPVAIGDLNWFRPHPHVLLTIFGSHTAPTVAEACAEEAKKTKVLGVGVEAWLPPAGGSASTGPSPSVVQRMRELSAAGHRVVWLVSLPALDCARPTVLQSRLEALRTWHQKDCAATFSVTVLVSVVSRRRRSDYTMPAAGLWQLLIEVPLGGRTPATAIFVGGCSTVCSSTEGERTTPERDPIDVELGLFPPGLSDQAFAERAGIPFVTQQDFARHGLQLQR